MASHDDLDPPARAKAASSPGDWARDMALLESTVNRLEDWAGQLRAQLHARGQE